MLATNTEHTKAFADRLSDLFSENNKSIKEIAAETGVASGSLSKYQNDGAEAGLNAVVKLAKYFGVSADWLLGLSNVRSPNVDKQAMARMTGLTEGAITVLTGFEQPFKMRVAGGIAHGSQRMPAPIEISQLIEHKRFLTFVESVRSMKLVNTGGVTNMVAEVTQKIHGRRGLWKTFREQAIEAIERILEDTAPMPEGDDETLIEKIAILTLWGASEEAKRRYMIDYISGKTNGEIVNEAGELLY